MSAAPPAARHRVRARIEGVVQGVGFRPHVYRIARELDLGGWVLNDEHGVLLEVEGPPVAVERFFEELVGEPPPLARVERVERENLAPTGEGEFAIAESRRSGEPEALVSADTATCPDCLAELFDPGDRRYRYPFVNCTNCGPRFTIVRGVPYDRSLTTMASFQMCERCRAEYEDPLDRRFHAQPNACPVCGPRAWLCAADGTELSPAEVAGEGAGLAGGPEPDAIAAAAKALISGRILAVKGIGGFHLACEADDERAVATLRARKRREDKPFALMAPDLDSAHSLVELTATEEALMVGRARPIVIAARRSGAAVAEEVAPRSGDLGVMLPYSPLHHLLLADAAVPLVMTSGNVSDEPIAYRDPDALERLARIADLFLVHDRPIETRTDDSVLRSHAAGDRGRPLLVRRSRGQVPEGVELPLEAPRHLLACGAELKSTFCIAKGTRAWVSHHIGDLENYETLRSFTDGVEHFENLFSVEPEVVIHDLHPEYLSTKYALDRPGVDRIGVQHHHAHLASCLAEHGRTSAVIGAIFDGTGVGPDGTVWGGEIIVGDLGGYERLGAVWPVRLPGGAAAIREPWRMACSWLGAATGSPVPAIPAGLGGEIPHERWEQVCELIRTGIASPITTSAGRLFDAVAAICGIRSRVNYEGQAAVELEAAADLSERGRYPLSVVRGADGPELVIDVREMIGALVADLGRGAEPAQASARFHNALAAGTVEACVEGAEKRGLDTLVLSGGVFQNRLLLERTAEAAAGRGLRVLLPERLPPNDGGISFGQAAVATARLRA